MAGPTPVSALIHAATMVVAGVYMVARLYGVFFAGLSIDMGGVNLLVLIGGVTMVLGASLAFVQYDIKRVLAYSTISQLGYMVTALGAGAWTAGVFHLFTHAFFKACLFLGAGSLSHACHHTFDMREMGGLRTKMRTTHWTFGIASLALAGVPPLAGFWSKDEILNGARASDYQAFMILGIIAAFMTAAYMGRAYYMVFWGEYRGHGEPHESPRVMTLPMTVLAVLAVGVGIINAPHIEKFGQWVKFESEVGNEYAVAHTVEGGPVGAAVGEGTAGGGEHATTAEGAAAAGEGHAGEATLVHSVDEIKALPAGTEAVFEPAEHSFNWPVAVGSTAVGLFGILISTWIYLLRKAPKRLLETSTPARALHTLLVNKYYFDALAVDGVAKGVAGPVARGSYWLNQNVIDGAVTGTGVATKRYLAPFFYDTLDQWMIDGVYNGSGEAVKGMGGLFRRLQTGRVQRYALWLFAGTAILAVVVATVT
jgi:NADH-quinone oxidoreductase subunit L